MSRRRSLQRFTGLVAGIYSLLLAVYNLIRMTLEFGVPLLTAAGSLQVSTIAACGLILLATRRVGAGGEDTTAARRWHTVATRWAQVVVFWGYGLIGASQSSTGNITSALFMIFGFLLFLEYRLMGVVGKTIAAILFGLYLSVLTFSYESAGGSGVLSTMAAISLVATFFLLFGYAVWLHLMQHRRESEQLEQRVSKRTEELAQALEERGLLLQELHHRVKNNMQLVSSLLNMEARNVSDSNARRAFLDSQRRIQSMALAHDVLYAGEEFGAIELSDYLRQLVETLKDGSGRAGVQFTATGTARAAVDLAVGIGLIVNELVTNALEHAFQDREAGTVHVAFHGENRMMRIEVGDDGVGLPDSFSLEKPAGLGLWIVNRLARQHGGRISVRKEQGTTWTVTFPFPSEVSGDE